MRGKLEMVVWFVVGVGAMGIAWAPEAPATTGHSIATSDAPPTPRRVADMAARLPASYDANEGQFEDGVRFVARGGGVTAWLLDGEAVLALGGDEPGRNPFDPDTRPRRRSGGVVRMGFGGDAPRGERPSQGHVSYFLGSDPSRWRADVATFERARCRGVAPGVDLVWRGTRSALEYDLVVEPGADPSAAVLRFEGAASVRLDASSGDLVVVTPAGGEMRHSRPSCFQSVDGAPRDVPGRFVVDGARVRFAVGDYDRSRELVIDPQISMATYFGTVDAPYDAVCGPSGDLYFCGATLATTMPIAAAYQSQLAGGSQGGWDGFVTRLKSDGSGLVFSTYLGGTNHDFLGGVAVDTQGNAYVVGQTDSTNFPVASAFQSTYGGGTYDGCVAKLNGTGNSVAYSTYLGGSGTDSASGVAVDATGALYVVGGTASTNFPTVNPRQSTNAGEGDGFLAKFAPSGGTLVYSTFHGGTGLDSIRNCAVDASGALYVIGMTQSTNLPTNNAFQATAGAYSDAFIAKYNAAGSALVYGTYLGGNGEDWIASVAVDAFGGLVVSGSTNSTNFPTVAPYGSTNGNGSMDAYVARVQPSGSALTFSTYLGGSGEDFGTTVLPDSAGAVVVIGYTNSTNFPAVNALQPSYGGGPNDSFVARFSGSPPTLAYSTYFGGSGQDQAYSGAFDASGSLFVVSDTTSPNRVVANAYQPAFQGDHTATTNAYIAKLVPASPVPPSGLNALLAGPSLAQLTWIDASNNETGFEIQRRVNAGAYTSYGTAQPGATSFDDTSLFGGTTYTYRVRALGNEGASTFTNEASVATAAGSAVPQPPVAPDRLEALVVSGTEVDLAWRDRSNDEMLFEVQRASGGGPFESMGTAPQDAVGLVDHDALPGWPVSYRVRALAAQGPSSFSNPVTATTPSTMTLATSSGLVTDSPKPTKDRLTWKGTFALGAAPPLALDPRTRGLQLQAGPRGAPVEVAIPPGDEAWKVRKSKYTWKSAKGVLPKVSVTIDTAKMTYSVKASGFDYSAPADTSARLLLSLGDDAGGVAQTWAAQRKPGSFAPPKP